MQDQSRPTRDKANDGSPDQRKPMRGRYESDAKKPSAADANGAEQHG
jgi:hypothetical protein